MQDHRRGLWPGSLLIAPLMELKSHTPFPMQSLSCTFNRTAYGIEIDKQLLQSLN